MSLSGSHGSGYHNQPRDSQLPAPTPSYTSTYTTSTGVAPHTSSSHLIPGFDNPWTAHLRSLGSQVSPPGLRASEGQRSLGMTTTTFSTPIHPASAQITGHGTGILHEVSGSQARVESSPNDTGLGGLAYASDLTPRTTESLSKESDTPPNTVLDSASGPSYLYQQSHYSTPKTSPVRQGVVLPQPASQFHNTPVTPTYIRKSYSHPAAAYQTQYPAHYNQYNLTAANAFSEGQSPGAFPRPILPSQPRETSHLIHGIAPENNPTFASSPREPHMALQHHTDRSAQASSFQAQPHPSPLAGSGVARQLPLTVNSNSVSQVQAHMTPTGFSHNVMATTAPRRTAQVQRVPLGNTTSLERKMICPRNLLQLRSPGLSTSHPTPGSEPNAFPNSAPMTPTTVDPSMVYNHYRGDRPQASSIHTSGGQQWAQAGITPTLAQKAAGTIDDQGSNMHSKTDDTDPINAKSTPNTIAVFTGPNAKGGDEGTDGSTAISSQDTEADVRMMLERMRQYHARNPSTFAKLWKETKKVRFIPERLSTVELPYIPHQNRRPYIVSYTKCLQSPAWVNSPPRGGAKGSPLTSHPSVPPSTSLSATGQDMKSSTEARRSSDPVPQLKRVRRNEDEDSNPFGEPRTGRVVDQQVLQARSKIDAGARNGQAPSTRIVSISTDQKQHTKPTASASSPHPPVMAQSGDSTVARSDKDGALWPEDMKIFFAKTAAQTLMSEHGNASKVITSNQIYAMLNDNLSYTQLCQKLKEMGFPVDKPRFAKILLATAIQGPAVSSHQENHPAQTAVVTGLVTSPPRETRHQHLPPAAAEGSRWKRDEVSDKVASDGFTVEKTRGEPTNNQASSDKTQAASSHTLQPLGTPTSNVTQPVGPSLDTRKSETGLSGTTMWRAQVNSKHGGLTKRDDCVALAPLEQSTPSHGPSESVAAPSLGPPKNVATPSLGPPKSVATPSVGNRGINTIISPTKPQTKSTPLPPPLPTSKEAAARKRSYNEIFDLTLDPFDGNISQLRNSSGLGIMRNVSGKPTNFTENAPESVVHSEHRCDSNKLVSTPTTCPKEAAPNRPTIPSTTKLEPLGLIRPINKLHAVPKENYHTSTIARDVLLTTGRYEPLPGLNKHLKILKITLPVVTNHSDLSTFKWGVITPVKVSDNNNAKAVAPGGGKSGSRGSEGVTPDTGAQPPQKKIKQSQEPQKKINSGDGSSKRGASDTGAQPPQEKIKQLQEPQKNLKGSGGGSKRGASDTGAQPPQEKTKQSQESQKKINSGDGSSKRGAPDTDTQPPQTKIKQSQESQKKINSGDGSNKRGAPDTDTQPPQKKIKQSQESQKKINSGDGSSKRGASDTGAQPPQEKIKQLQEPQKNLKGSGGGSKRGASDTGTQPPQEKTKQSQESQKKINSGDGSSKRGAPDTDTQPPQKKIKQSQKPQKEISSGDGISKPGSSDTGAQPPQEKIKQSQESQKKINSGDGSNKRGAPDTDTQPPQKKIKQSQKPQKEISSGDGSSKPGSSGIGAQPPPEKIKQSQEPQKKLKQLQVLIVSKGGVGSGDKSGNTATSTSVPHEVSCYSPQEQHGGEPESEFGSRPRVESAPNQIGSIPELPKDLRHSTPSTVQPTSSPIPSLLLPRQIRSSAAQHHQPSNLHARPSRNDQPATSLASVAIMVPRPLARAANRRRGSDSSISNASKADSAEGLPLPVYRCYWQDCEAELHNLLVLQRHLQMVHGHPRADGNFACLWGHCGIPDSSSSNLLPFEQREPRLFSTMERWYRHVKRRHVEPYAWHYGDGPLDPGQGWLRTFSTSSVIKGFIEWGLTSL